MYTGTVRLDDEFFDVVVTCINSPIDFYVQKCENDKLVSSNYVTKVCAYLRWSIILAAGVAGGSGHLLYIQCAKR